MHARPPYRCAHGFVRGLMRSILQLRVPQDRLVGDGDQLGSLSKGVAVENDAPTTRFRDPQIEMAHGAGGKASRRLVEGLFAPLLFAGSTGPLADAGSVHLDGASLALTTDSFVVKPLKF